ncbi:S8 family serine peptidase [Sphingomonas aliaeris]|uniref:S8 family serine peptidase n=1 Tax=Sphingomonas aliaeris TaxID=2759526 RepID=A0A974S417_9SPHN|nr:S8 family serine peptidase [Sphingomonas aliaeris]QQV76959.1 S8 family serine peptidase [Sphingomonas aliaeris]
MTQTAQLKNSAAWTASSFFSTTAEKTPVVDGPIGRSYGYYTGKVVTTAFDLFYPGAIGVPEFSRQWHLTRLGDIGKVWEDYTGRGVSVGVYDSGVQSTHWDLARNYDASKHVVVDGITMSGEPGADMQGHGTSVAGLIAAARNGRAGVGVAFDAQVTGINIFNAALPIDVNGGNSAAFFNALSQANQFDVVNHSWGDSRTSVSTANSRATPGTFQNLLSESFAYAAETGRGGLGTITIGAAGNDGRDHQSQGSKTDRHGIAVSAYREADGVSSYYTSKGAHILVAGPSNDFSELGGTGLVATDLLGVDGYNMNIDPETAADYTDSFGGTSGATPVVTGVVSLILDANEGLGWRDVKNILAASAKMPVAFETGAVVQRLVSNGFTVLVGMNENPFQLNGDTAGWNGGAMHFSNDYGYGAVDAYGAVRMAEVWSLFRAAPLVSGNETMATTGIMPVGLTANTDIDLSSISTFDANSDITGTPQRFTFEVNQSTDVEHIDLTINYTHTAIEKRNGQIESTLVGGLANAQFKLIAPDGTVGFTFQDGDFFEDSGPGQEFVFGFSGFRGVETKGTWTLEFQSLDMDFDVRFPGNDFPLIDNSLTLNSIKMDMFGSTPTADDVYTYTNEFFTMKAIDGESATRGVLSDTNGGADWINAAAVTKAVDVSLAAGGRTTFGGNAAFTIAAGSVIENVVTGDGADRLLGNGVDNKLYGMRGNDWLNGGAGNDTLFGGTGNDVFWFETLAVSGKDKVLDWSFGDTIATSKQLRGADQNGILTVGSNALLLLDNSVRGDTAELVGEGGATLIALGKSNGQWIYGFLTEGDADFTDGRVQESSLGQTGRAANDTAAFAFAELPGAHTGNSFDMHQAAFYLYDTMGDAMATGAQLYA